MRSRLALLVFVAVLAIALPIYLYYGRHRWFFFDEWDFLVTRDGGDLGDLFRPHNAHWVTLPIMAYRVLWRLVGLHSYLPYRVLLVVMHLIAAVLLRVIMRRAGVDPWIATAAASLFVLFGAGHQNILWAFQICFVAALVFGLCHLLLADHDGPVDHRDWWGIAAGVAGLMCSGVGVTMIAVVGLATLTRRGWRAALLHTGPPAALYLVWWLTVARDRRASNSGVDFEEAARFVATGLAATFDAMGQVPGVGLLFGAVLVAGSLLVWQQRADVAFRSRIAAPAAMAAGALMFLITSAIGRAGAHGGDAARAGRYLHIVVALLLPAVAVAAAAIAKRSRLFAPVMVALLVVGIPGNLRVLIDLDSKGDISDRAGFHRYYRTTLLSAPRVPVATEVPAWIQLEPTFARPVTIGWLRSEVAAGRLPDPRPIDPLRAASVSLRLALYQAERAGPSAACGPLTEPREIRLDEGESLGIRDGAVRVVLLTDAGRSQVFVFAPEDGTTLEALAGPLQLRIQSNAPAQPSTLCVQ
jgi:hypothetical protein